MVGLLSTLLAGQDTWKLCSCYCRNMLMSASPKRYTTTLCITFSILCTSSYPTPCWHSLHTYKCTCNYMMSTVNPVCVDMYLSTITSECQCPLVYLYTLQLLYCQGRRSRCGRCGGHRTNVWPKTGGCIGKAHDAIKERG